jgi:hypothetical protein
MQYSLWASLTKTVYPTLLNGRMLVPYNLLVGAGEPPQPQFKLSLMLHMKLYLSLHTTMFHNWSFVSSSNLFAEDELTFKSYSFALHPILICWVKY